MSETDPAGSPSTAAVRAYGACDARFAGVREAFEANFQGRGQLGAGVCISIDGRVVVDLWGGFADAARSRPWRRDTWVNVFSVGKGLLAVCFGVLVDRFGLDLDAPVARYWPEFAVAGKESISVRELASHRGGLPGIRAALPPGAMYDWSRMTETLARESPWWEPGTAHGYHVNSYGFLIGELVRRVSGERVGAFLRDVVANPLAAEVAYGAPESHAGEIADCQVPAGPLDMPGEDAEHKRWLDAAYANPQGISGNGSVNTPAWRAAELPSANAHATARGLVSVYTGLARGASVREHEIVSAATLGELTTEHASGHDLILRRPSRFGLGFQLTTPERPLGPNRRSFGHFGAGGSLGFADPEAAVAFGYVINRPGARWQNPCARALIDAFYAVL